MLAGLEEIWDDPGISTCAINPWNLFYSRDFFNRLNLDEKIFVLAHEASHFGLRHFTREDGRDHLLWNYATDYVINGMLHSSGFIPPKDVLLDHKYDGMSAEQVYAELLKNPPPPPPQSGDSEPCENGSQGESGSGTHPGDHAPPHPGAVDNHNGWGKLVDKDGNQISDATLDRIVRDAVVRAATLAKSAGKLPGAWESIINEFLNPKIDWRTKLKDFVTTSNYNDFRMSPPNKWFLPHGYYLPGMRGEFLEGVLAMDTSGSVSDAELMAGLTELRGICQTFQSYKIHVIQCDAAIHSDEEVISESDISKKVFGRGGTSFHPVFKSVREKINAGEDIKFLVYVTDGYPNNDWPADDLGIPVLWLITTDVIAPMGETVKLEVDNKR
jgi:predicted metal-dependent peptidase